MRLLLKYFFYDLQIYFSVCECFVCTICKCFPKKIYVLAILSVTVLDPISFRPDNIVSQIFKILISLSYTQNKSNGSGSSSF